MKNHGSLVIYVFKDMTWYDLSRNNIKSLLKYKYNALCTRYEIQRM